MLIQMLAAAVLAMDSVVGYGMQYHLVEQKMAQIKNPLLCHRKVVADTEPQPHPSLRKAEINRLQRTGLKPIPMGVDILYGLASGVIHIDLRPAHQRHSLVGVMQCQGAGVGGSG